MQKIFSGIAYTYVGLHTSTDTKDIFLELQKQKKNLSRGDVKQVSRRRFVSVCICGQKPRNPHNNTMTKSTSLLSKAALAAKKKYCKYYRPFWIFLKYFMQLQYSVKGLIAFLLSFYVRSETVDVLTMLFSFSLHQNSPPLVPYNFYWFCRFDADGNQLFVVVERVVNAAIILAIIFFVLIDREVNLTTLC
jgi:hypothetical protein